VEQHFVGFPVHFSESVMGEPLGIVAEERVITVFVAIGGVRRQRQVFLENCRVVTDSVRLRYPLPIICL
jgi:hypothetical protein